MHQDHASVGGHANRIRAALEHRRRWQYQGMTESFPRQRALTRNFTLGAPRAFSISDDGHHVLFLRSAHGRDSSASLWVYDIMSNVERMVADPRSLLADSEHVPAAERARRERMRETGSGITAYSTDTAGNRVAFALAGQLFTADIGAGTTAALDVTGPVIDPQVSPDGHHIAWTTGSHVHVCEFGGGAAAVVAGGDGLQWGIADFIAAEELERQRGFWWSPDGTALLVESVDESPVQRQWISDPAVSTSAPREQRYPAAGTANAIVALHVVHLAGDSHPISWDAAAYEYLVSVSWQVGGQPLITLASRDQRHMTTFTMEEDFTLTPVLDLADNRFLEVVPGQPRWLEGALVSVQDDLGTDTRRLFLDGKPLTPPGIQVLSVIGASDGIVDVVFTSRAIDRRVARVDRTGHMTEVTGAGVAGASRSVATDSGRVQVVVQAELNDTERTQTLMRDGSPIHVFETLAERPTLTPTVHHITAGPRAVNTAVLFPSGHVHGSAALPVMMRPYGGPHGAQVLEDGVSYCEDQWFADQGFVVVIADGRGTPGRGPAWDRSIHHDFVNPVLDDQVDALRAAAEHFPGDLDLTRVGITGWSFGGYLSALAVAERPDIFHAAVAGAPVTDWALYDTAYTERYLGDPREVPEVYQANSVVARAEKLQRPLMLVHGLADDNVVSAHTLSLSGELLTHCKPHTVVPLSGVTHMTPQAVVTENLMLLTVDFFESTLGRPSR